MKAGKGGKARKHSSVICLGRHCPVDSVSHVCNFYFLVTFLKLLKGEIRLNKIFYLTQYVYNIISTCNQYKAIEILYTLFLAKSSTSGVYFTLTARLSLDWPRSQSSGHVASGRGAASAGSV